MYYSTCSAFKRHLVMTVDHQELDNILTQTRKQALISESRMHPHAQCQPPPRPYHPLGPALQPDEQESHVFNETSVDVIIVVFRALLEQHSFSYLFTHLSAAIPLMDTRKARRPTKLHA